MAKQLHWYVIFLVLICITVFFQFSAKYQVFELTNHFVQDSYTYELRVLYERSTTDFFADAYTSINRILYFIGPFSFLIVNTLMLLACVYMCKIFLCISPGSVSLARFIIVFNPYFLVGAIGPLKEITLVFLSLLAFTFFFKEHTYFKLISLLIAILSLFIRPFFGFVLIGSLLLSPFLSIFKNPIRMFLAILVFYFACNSIPVINAILTSEQGEELSSFRSSNLYEVAMFLKLMNQNPILQFPAFLIKTGLILITPIFRPISLYSNPFPILDIGYTFMAYCLLPFNISLLVLFFDAKKTSLAVINKNAQIIILYCLIGILTTIINSNITFRYIFPYSPIIVSLFYLHNIKIRNRILVPSLLLLLITFIGTSIFLRKEFEVEVPTIPEFMSWL